MNEDMMELEDFKKSTFETVDATLIENLEATKTLQVKENLIRMKEEEIAYREKNIVEQESMLDEKKSIL